MKYRCLLPTLVTRVQSLGPLWWKERTHTYTCFDTHKNYPSGIGLGSQLDYSLSRMAASLWFTQAMEQSQATCEAYLRSKSTASLAW